MLLASSFIVAALTSDFLETRVEKPSFDPQTVYAESGTGELLVTFDSSGTFGSVPRGATRIAMGTLNFSASCGADIQIRSLKLRHIGLGSTSDISGVYLADGFRRVSRSSRFDPRSATVDLRVPSLKVPSCGAVRLFVLMDLSADADVASEHGVTFLSASDLDTSAKSVTFGGADASTSVRASPVVSGGVAVNFLPVPGRLRYGRTETVARIQLSADAQHDYLLKSITLTNDEDARDMDLTRLQLVTRSGTGVSLTAARMRGRVVTLDFSPTYILERSRTVVFLLRAEIHATRYRKVRFLLEEPSDLGVTIYRPGSR